ncbi:MAG TPA: FtsX-like permease family protein, partial [Thermoanaerobaculia bacterium]|nr:FtsX-like permease family protein [Thermoanaerobaculia bacterium]
MLLRSLVLRPFLRDKLRALLTLIGVAVGVAVVVAIQLANQSSLRAFRESVDAVAGRANYQIVGEAGTLDENLLLPLQRFWGSGVRFAPVIDVDGVIEPGQIPLRLLAVDLLSDLHFRDYRYAEISVDPGRSPAGSAGRFLEVFRPDSVILPAPFARDQGLALGSPITVNVLGNRRRMVIRGVLESRGPATAFNGSIAICDVATAQSAFGLTGRLTRVDLLIPEAVAPSVVEQVRQLLPAGTRIERPSRRNERVERMLRAFRVNLYALASVALLVGIFLVYNTVLISILRRRRDVGIARTLGSSSTAIAGAFLLEGLTLGLAGSAIGLVLGRGMAVGILRLVGRTINSLYVTSRPDEISLSSTVVAAALITGTLLSLLASLHPAIEASRVPPETMTRQGLHQRIERQRRGMLTAIAAACFIAAAATTRIPPIGGIAVAGYLSVLLVVIGFSMLSPLMVQWTARALGPLLGRVFGPAGRLAASSLPASLRRTSIAAASLSVAIGMMVAVALMVGSFRITVNTWVRQTVQSD